MPDPDFEIKIVISGRWDTTRPLVLAASLLEAAVAVITVYLAHLVYLAYLVHP